MDAYLDMNCSVKRLQWELCQFARKECASKDAPPPGTPAPQARTLGGERGPPATGILSAPPRLHLCPALPRL